MRRTRIKRISAFLVFIFMFTLLPVTQLQAADPLPRIDKIDLIKTYNGIDDINGYVLAIRGAGLLKTKVWRQKADGKSVELRPSRSSDVVLEFSIPHSTVDEGNIVLKKIEIESEITSLEIDIAEDNMPRIKTLAPTKIKRGGDGLEITGENFDQIGTAANKVRAEYISGSTPTTIIDAWVDAANNKIEIPNDKITGELGSKNIYFIRESTLDSSIKIDPSDPTHKDIKLNVEYRHLNIFRTYDDLAIQGNVEMYPNRGPQGTRVNFEAEELPEDMSVFFLKAGDSGDSFKSGNKGKFINYFNNVYPVNDKLVVEVPALAVGEYDVYFTNKVADGELPEHKVIREKKLDQRFTVISSNVQGQILGISPNRGPDKGIDNVIIQARNIASISPTVFEAVYGSRTVAVKLDEFGVEELVIEEKGKYKEFNKNVDAEMKRTVKFLIGTYVEFNAPNAETVSPGGLDRISVNILSTSMVEKDTPVDVTAIIKTTVTYMEGGKEIKLPFQEEVVRINGFTFYPSSIEPVIENVVPDKIMISISNEITEDRMIAIYGKNFMIHKYQEAGQDVVRYPIIELGKVIDTNPDLKVLVMDSAGNILDGSAGREVGTKILITIPKGTRVSEPGKANVSVTNPMRFSSEKGRTGTAIDIIEYVVDVEKPYITRVNPDVVTVAGGEEVVVEGTNFRPGVKVFIDGNEVKNVVRDGTGTHITFKAPPGRAGTTQLQVMNEDGGIAIWPFTYVTTYTDPKITDFNPKKGSYDTLVVVKGQNFLRPDPTGAESEILKLIGTRILLENEDINQYYRDEYNRIALQDYESPADKKVIDDNGHLASYYHSVIFENAAQPGSYYVLRQTPNGTVQLTNGKEATYTIEKSATSLRAKSQAGQSHDLVVETDYIVVQETTPLRLVMKTPYHVDNKIIVGNRVKVIGNDEIQFTVPRLNEGYHDVTVINPDTKRDSRTDNQGFYYYIQPDSDPEIYSIVPEEGSVKGEYTIDIIGQDFQDDGQKKVSVTINGIAISPQDTIVSTDGTKVTVKVPPYPGDLWKDKGTGRWAVPVVLVNPDGASASKEKGFTYVVPSSNPEIIKLEPAKGSAAGNDVVEITGRDFRFFEPYEDLNNNRLWDPNEPYTDINHNGVYDDYRNKTALQLQEELGDAYEDLVIPVLPKVYFGDKRAEILEFSSGYLRVRTPAGKLGTVDVYVVNNDAGVSPKVSFSYEGSNPKITKLVPAEGSRFGREKVEVVGTGFFSSKIKVYANSYTNTVDQEMPVVRFGNIQNLNRIDNQRTTVVLDGGLEVSYDATNASNKKVKITLKEGSDIYEATLENYDDMVKYVNLGLLRSSSGGTVKNYDGYELIRLEVLDRRLKVERGYSPQVSAPRSTQMVVITPSYYTVGKVTVTIFNPDGGTTEGSFEYKNPDSRPQITNITRDTRSPVNTFIDGKAIKLLNINYQGKSRVAVFGSDFREGAKIQIGTLFTIDPKDITYELPNKLSFVMPDVPENALNELYRVIVVNTDGASAASDLLDPPIMLQFTKGETAPKISNITPLLGPVSGGTVVKIEGEDFRGAMEGYKGVVPQVYFGEQPAAQIEVVDYKTIQAISPVNKPGLLGIRVENPDGAISTPGGDFNYISNPKVTAVINATDPTETSRLNNISVEGGQEIKIKGVGFMEGAKVIFMPVATESASDTGGNIIYRVGTKQEEYSGRQFTSNVIVNYLLESGTEGTEVKFIDAETLTVKVPPGKLEGKGLIVLNPDKGASDIFDDITYGLPELEAPLGVIAEIIHDKYNNTDTGIKVTWTEVKGAVEYELYVVEDGQMEFIGSTKLLAYIHEDIEPRTTYKFIVKAVGDFGSSKPSAESNTVRTGRNVGLPDHDGGLSENTRQEKKGQTAQVSLGTTENRANIVIDLTRGDLAGCKEVVLSIPAEVISNSRYMNIDIRGTDFAIKLTPAVFNNAKVSQSAGKNEAGVRFTVKPVNSNTNSSANGLSSVYEIKADFYEGQATTPIDYLAANMSLILDYDIMKANMRKFSNVSISRHDPYSNNWQVLHKDNYLSGSTSTIINRMGSYAVMGGRN